VLWKRKEGRIGNLGDRLSQGEVRYLRDSERLGRKGGELDGPPDTSSNQPQSTGSMNKGHTSQQKPPLL
jgi:hypothetical protein